MRSMRVLLVIALFAAFARPSQAQTKAPGENTVAIGGDVGFVAAAYEDEHAWGTADAYVEYYYTPRFSLRGLYGWAETDLREVPGIAIRRQQVALNVIYNYQFGRFRPFATIGGGAYFLQRRQQSSSSNESLTKPGANFGWGLEFDFRTFAVKSEMNVHVIGEEDRFPEVGDKTLSGFTWTFGLKVPF